MNRFREIPPTHKFDVYAPATPRAYLDVETTASYEITVIGVYRPDKGPRHWIKPRLSAQELRDFLSGISVLMTYNGAKFDLPLIEQQLQINLVQEFNHRDLMFDCWSQNHFGGLKKVEKKLGIHRDTEGVDGLMAIQLWDRYSAQNDKEALDLLLRYNREDVENLESLARALRVVDRPGESKQLVFGMEA